MNMEKARSNLVNPLKNSKFLEKLVITPTVFGTQTPGDFTYSHQYDFKTPIEEIVRGFNTVIEDCKDSNGPLVIGIFDQIRIYQLYRVV